MSSINYRGLGRRHLNSASDAVNLRNEAGHHEIVSKSARGAQRAEWLDVSQPRCFTYSSVTSKSSCNFRSPLESVPRGSACPQRGCHHSKYQTPKTTQQEESAKRPLWDGPCTTRGKYWYYCPSLPLICNHNFSPCKTLIFVTINWKWCQCDTFFPGLHLPLNRYRYREIPRLLHAAAVWFIPWSNK